MSQLTQIFHNLANTTERFLPSFKSQQDFEALMFRYGWLVDLDDEIEKIKIIADLATAFASISTTIAEWVDDEDKEEVETENNENKKDKDWKDYLKKLYPEVKKVYKAILKLKDVKEEDIKKFGAPLNTKEFWNEIPERLIEDIFTLTLQRHYPIAYGFFHLFGIIEYIEKEPTGENRVNYTQTDIKWERLGHFISKRPDGLFKEVYLWGSDDFQWEKLLHNLERTFLANRFLTRYILPRRSVVEGFNMDPEWVFGHELHELQLPLIYGTSILDESFYNIGLGIMPIGSSNAAGTKPNGILITPILQGGLDHSFFITPEISLNFGFDIDANNVLAAKILPSTVELDTNLPSADFSLDLVGSPYEPWVIFGSRDSHRLELRGFEMGFSVAGKLDDPEFKISFKATSTSPEERGVQLFIDLGDSDSFLQKNSKSETNKIEAGFDLELEWSSKTGFQFGGNVDFDFQMHINKGFGFLEVTNLYLSLEAEGSSDNKNSIQLHSGIGLRGKLGPIQYFIENTGFDFNIIPTDAKDMDPDNPPALGMMDFDLGFAPPKGIGILIDAPRVKGGGYLEIQDHRYIGAAELTIVETLSIKAIAIIDTELPDGKDGYSFLLMITAEFNAIQLGFGFTLNGVGGLVGIHRSMSLDAIREKVKGDEFNHVLFPTNPVQNIKKIVASLDEIFPIQEGQYSFGIMAKLGWGTPNIIDIKAGLFIQVPDFKIAIIGVVKAEIFRKVAAEKEGDEDKEVVLLRIQLSFTAWYDKSKSLFGFDASLFNSEVLGISLTGDSAIRLRGGDDPYFMMSIGGFHPDFEVPQGMALGSGLKRLALSLKPESIPIDLSCQLYFAITANTVQFGVKIAAAYRSKIFTIEGEIGFDALFQFRPIYFKVDAWGRVAIYIWGKSWGGLEIRGSIEGPYPFTFSLYVKFKVWKWTKTKRIPSFTIGSNAKEEKPKIDVLNELQLVLEDNRNWHPVLPKRNELLVALREKNKDESDSKPEEEKELILHPIGGLKIDQTRVPLGIRIDKFGHNQPDIYNYFSVGLEEEEEGVSSYVQQFFAPDQFFNVKNENKLTSKSFEKLASGIQLNGFDDIEIGDRVLTKKIEYEVAYYDPHTPYGSHEAEKRVAEPAMTTIDFENIYGKNTAISKSTLGRKNAREENTTQTLEQSIEQTDNEYVIIHEDDNPNFSEIKTQSKAEAEQKLNQILNEHPEWEDELVIVPIFETV